MPLVPVAPRRVQSKAQLYCFVRVEMFYSANSLQVVIIMGSDIVEITKITDTDLFSSWI